MKTNRLLIATSILIMLVATVSAFGVSAPYWDGNPLTMARGEVKVINLNIQNMVGDEDVTVQAELVKGSDITALEDTTFLIEAGTSNTMVPLKIKMPKEATPGETKPIQVEFKTVAGDTGGIAMGTGMTISFNAVAGEDTAQTNTGMIITVIISIAVLALLLWALSKRKKKK